MPIRTLYLPESALDEWVDFQQLAQRRGRSMSSLLLDLIRGELRSATHHEQVAGWGGQEEGSCGAECACGLVYDGFDTLTEPTDLIQKHIAEEVSDRG